MFYLTVFALSLALISLIFFFVLQWTNEEVRYVYTNTYSWLRFSKFKSFVYTAIESTIWRKELLLKWPHKVQHNILHSVGRYWNAKKKRLGYKRQNTNILSKSTWLPFSIDTKFQGIMCHTTDANQTRMKFYFFSIFIEFCFDIARIVGDILASMIDSGIVIFLNIFFLFFIKLYVT